MQVGIDKLKLHTREFRIGDNAPVILDRGARTLDGEAIDANNLFPWRGEIQMGKKAYFNHELFNMTINPKGFFVEFNPARIEHDGRNHLPTTPRGFVSSIASVERLLREHDIHTDISSCGISRIDLQKTAEMNHPFADYAPAFQFMKGKRMRPNSYPTTYSFSNTAREISWYDKREQMEMHGHEVHDVPENSLRGEVRLKSKATVKRTLGAQIVKDIQRPEFAHDAVPKRYAELLKDGVFRLQTDGEQLTLDIEREADLLRHIKSQSPKAGFKKWLLLKGLDHALLNFGSLENIGKIMKEAGYERTRIHRNLKEISALIALKSQVNKGQDSRSLSALFDELHTKFLYL